MGYNTPLLSYFSAFQYFLHGRDIIQRGYDKVGTLRYLHNELILILHLCYSTREERSRSLSCSAGRLS